MSLINDALKRANQSQKQPVRPRLPLSPMQPVESIRRPAAWSSYLVPGLLVVVLAMAGWFLHAWWQSRQNPMPPVLAIVPPSALTSVSSVKPVGPAPVVPPVAPAVPITIIKVNTNLVVRGTPSVPPADLTGAPIAKVVPVEPLDAAITPVQFPVPIPETKPVPSPATLGSETNVTLAVTVKPIAKPAFPEIRLQGIFYRVAKPSVLINSRTLFINDKVEGVKVIAIDRLSVTLEFEGQRRVLPLD